MKLKIITTALTTLVAAATLIFLSKTFLAYQQQAQDIILSTPPIKIIAAFLLFLGHLYLRALSWRSLIYFLGASLNKHKSLTIWFFSEATRYIPVGKIWSFTSRAYLAQQNKVPPKISILILPVEVVIVTTTTAILSSYAIIKTLEKLPVNLTFYILVITSLTATLGLFLLHKTTKKMLKTLLIQPLVPKALPAALILQGVSWSLYSAGYIVLISDIAKVQDLSLLLSSTLLSWLIGYLAIVSPMGLGVRESAFVILVGAQIGTAQAITVAVLSRVILIVSELVNLAFWAGMKGRLHFFKFAKG